MLNILPQAANHETVPKKTMGKDKIWKQLASEYRQQTLI